MATAWHVTQKYNAWNYEQENKHQSLYPGYEA